MGYTFGKRLALGARVMLWKRLLSRGLDPQLANRRQPFMGQSLPFPAWLSLSGRSEIGAHGFKSGSGLLLGSGSGVGMKHGVSPRWRVDRD